MARYDYEGQIDDGFFKLIDEYKKSNNKILVNLYHCHRAVDSFCRNNIESIFTVSRQTSLSASIMSL